MKFVLKKPAEYALPESILKNYRCTRIYTYFEIHAQGNVSLCCYSWLPEFFGNVIDDSPEEIYKNLERIKLLKYMDNGEFEKCNDKCPFLSSILNGANPNIGYVVPEKTFELKKENDIIIVNFSYDQSCNLQCPSCRNNLILYQLNENEKLQQIHKGVKEFVNYLLSLNKKILLKITGSGDAFASPIYWDYIKELSNNPTDNLQLSLHTNGILMDETRLNEIEPLWKNIHTINISVDAATEETYKIVRKGGNFSKLEQNLTNINKLIKNKKFPNLKKFIINFTVQQRNYKEIKSFVKWQFTFDQIDHLYFSLVDNWNHISYNTFNDEYKLNSDQKKELRTILKDPIFLDKKIILGNLNSLTLKNE